MSMKKILVIIVAFLILAGSGYWYFVLRQSNQSLPLLPDISSLLSSERSLQGIWTAKEVYATDPAKGELKLLPDQGGKANSYFEFKGDMFCTSGRLDPNRKPYPCSKYQPFSVSGDKINFEDFSQPMIAHWKFVSGNLELTLEAPAGGGKTQKVKFILMKLN